MDIDDAALMYEGWGDEMLYDQQISRKVTMLICEVVNKSMGGKGVMKNAGKMWPLPGDDKKKTIDLVSKLQQHNELNLQHGLKKAQRRNGKR